MFIQLNLLQSGKGRRMKIVESNNRSHQAAYSNQHPVSNAKFDDLQQMNIYIIIQVIKYKMLPIKAKLSNILKLCDHHEISAFNGKRVKGDNDSAIKEYDILCNHSSDFDNFSILASNNIDSNVTLLESLLMNRDHAPLNKNRLRYLWNFLLIEKRNFII